MSARKGPSISRARLSVLVALALSACAGPAAVATETASAPLATATAAVDAESTPVSNATATLSINNAVNFDQRGLTFDADGQLYLSECGRDLGPNQVVKIDRAGFVAVYAGEGPRGFSGDGGQALAARFDCPGALAFDRNGNLYIADTNNYRVRRIDRDGVISTVAGSGPANENTLARPFGYAGDGGPATQAKLAGDGGLAIDAAGNLYIADASNNRIRNVDRQGIITTFAGNGTAGFSGDGGPATHAQIDTQSERAGMAITFDAAGNLFLADRGNARVRRVDRDGMITTIAGTGVPGFSGDGGLATAAQLARPAGLAFDADGNLYIADDQIATEDGGRIRKIDLNGIITTIAGGGDPGGAVDGRLAVASWLRHPGSLAFDDQGNLYFVETENNLFPTQTSYNVIRKVDRNGIITTVLKANS